MLCLGVAYLVSLVVSDFYRGSDPRDFLRGWAKISLTLTAYLTFLGVVQDRANIAAFFWGAVASLATALAVEGGILPLDTENYKWTYGTPLTLASFLVAGYLTRHFHIVGLALPAAVGVLSFLMNFRSLAGLTLLAVFLATLKSLPGFREVSIARAAGVTVAVFLAASGIFSFYVWAAPQGLLGETAQAKFAMQSSGQGGGKFSLLSGRGEILFAAPKILESPWIGWGSWARDIEFVELRHKELHGNKYLGGVAGDEGVIPTHSHVVGGWIEAGIIGAFFWVACLWLIGRNLLFSSPTPLGNALFVVLLFTGLELCWHVVFSPFGAGRRVETGIFIAWHVTVANALGFGNLTSIVPSRQGRVPAEPANTADQVNPLPVA